MIANAKWINNNNNNNNNNNKAMPNVTLMACRVSGNPFL